MKIVYDKTAPAGVTTLMRVGDSSLDGILSDNEAKVKTAAIAGVVGYLASRFLNLGPPKLIGLGLFGYFLVK